MVTLNKVFSFIVSQVSIHPKTAIIVSLVIGALVTHYVGL